MLAFNRLTAVVTTQRFDYWMDVWDERLRFYMMSERGLKYLNVVLVLELVVEELTSRRLRSLGIREMLRHEIYRYAKLHPTISGLAVAEELRQLANDLSKAPTVDLLHRSRYWLNEVASVDFITRSFDKLTGLLNRVAPFVAGETAAIELLTDDLIVRLLRRGYGIQRLQQIPGQVFSTYTEVGDGLMVRFPMEAIDPQLRFGPGGFVPHDRTDEVQAILDGLSLAARVQAMLWYFKCPPQAKQYIFGIDGLRGNASFSLGQVKFYSPVAEPLITNPPANDAEIEFIGRSGEHQPVNAVVTVQTLDEIEGEHVAQNEVERSLDMLRLEAESVVPLAVRKHRRILTNPELGIFSFRESQTERPEFATQFAIDILGLARHFEEHRRLRELLENLLNKDPDYISRQLLGASHWYRKGYESARTEDKLLFYWVALEKIFSAKPSTDPLVEGGESRPAEIAAVMPVIATYLFALSSPQRVKDHVSQLWVSGAYRGFPPRLQGNDLAQFVGDEVAVTWSTFEHWLNLLIGVLPPSYLRDYVEAVQSYCLDANAAARTLNDYRMETEAEIKIIYWLRNRLVHDAEFEHPALEYYTQVLRGLTSTAIRLSLDPEQLKDGHPPIEILLGSYQKGARFLRELKGGHTTIREYFDH